MAILLSENFWSIISLSVGQALPTAPVLLQLNIEKRPHACLLYERRSVMLLNKDMLSDVINKSACESIASYLSTAEAGKMLFTQLVESDKAEINSEARKQAIYNDYVEERREKSRQRLHKAHDDAKSEVVSLVIMSSRLGGLLQAVAVSGSTYAKKALGLQTVKGTDNKNYYLLDGEDLKRFGYSKATSGDMLSVTVSPDKIRAVIEGYKNY